MNITQTTSAATTQPGADPATAVPFTPAKLTALSAAAVPPTAASAATAAAKTATTPSKTDLKNSVDQINRFLKVNSEVEFSIDHNSGKSVIKVVDTETNKVLRQFPSEQALQIGQNLQDSKSGLIDEQA